MILLKQILKEIHKRRCEIATHNPSPVELAIYVEVGGPIEQLLTELRQMSSAAVAPPAYGAPIYFAGCRVWTVLEEGHGIKVLEIPK